MSSSSRYPYGDDDRTVISFGGSSGTTIVPSKPARSVVVQELPEKYSTSKPSAIRKLKNSGTLSKTNWNGSKVIAYPAGGAPSPPKPEEMSNDPHFYDPLPAGSTSVPYGGGRRVIGTDTTGYSLPFPGESLTDYFLTSKKPDGSNAFPIPKIDRWGRVLSPFFDDPRYLAANTVEEYFQSALGVDGKKLYPLPPGYTKYPVSQVLYNYVVSNPKEVRFDSLEGMKPRIGIFEDTRYVLQRRKTTQTYQGIPDTVYYYVRRDIGNGQKPSKDFWFFDSDVGITKTYSDLPKWNQSTTLREYYFNSTDVDGTPFFSIPLSVGGKFYISVADVDRELDKKMFEWTDFPAPPGYRKKMTIEEKKHEAEEEKRLRKEVANSGLSYLTATGKLEEFERNKRRRKNIPKITYDDFITPRNSSKTTIIAPSSSRTTIIAAPASPSRTTIIAAPAASKTTIIAPAASKTTIIAAPASPPRTVIAPAASKTTIIAPAPAASKTTIIAAPSSPPRTVIAPAASKTTIIAAPSSPPRTVIAPSPASFYDPLPAGSKFVPANGGRRIIGTDTTGFEPPLPGQSLKDYFLNYQTPDGRGFPKPKIDRWGRVICPFDNMCNWFAASTVEEYFRTAVGMDGKKLYPLPPGYSKYPVSETLYVSYRHGMAYTIPRIDITGDRRYVAKSFDTLQTYGGKKDKFVCYIRDDSVPSTAQLPNWDKFNTTLREYYFNSTDYDGTPYFNIPLNIDGVCYSNASDCNIELDKKMLGWTDFSAPLRLEKKDLRLEDFVTPRTPSTAAERAQKVAAQRAAAEKAERDARAAVERAAAERDARAAAERAARAAAEKVAAERAAAEKTAAVVAAAERAAVVAAALVAAERASEKAAAEKAAAERDARDAAEKAAAEAAENSDEKDEKKLELLDDQLERIAFTSYNNSRMRFVGDKTPEEIIEEEGYAAKDRQARKKMVGMINTFEEGPFDVPPLSHQNIYGQVLSLFGEEHPDMIAANSVGEFIRGAVNSNGEVYTDEQIKDITAADSFFWKLRKLIRFDSRYILHSEMTSKGVRGFCYTRKMAPPAVIGHLSEGQTLLEHYFNTWSYDGLPVYAIPFRFMGKVYTKVSDVGDDERVINFLRTARDENGDLIYPPPKPALQPGDEGYLPTPAPVPVEKWQEYEPFGRGYFDETETSGGTFMAHTRRLRLRNPFDTRYGGDLYKFWGGPGRIDGELNAYGQVVRQYSPQNIIANTLEELYRTFRDDQGELFYQKEEYEQYPTSKLYPNRPDILTDRRFAKFFVERGVFMRRQYFRVYYERRMLAPLEPLPPLKEGQSLANYYVTTLSSDGLPLFCTGLTSYDLANNFAKVEKRLAEMANKLDEDGRLLLPDPRAVKLASPRHTSPLPSPKTVIGAPVSTPMSPRHTDPVLYESSSSSSSHQTVPISYESSSSSPTLRPPSFDASPPIPLAKGDVFEQRDSPEIMFNNNYSFGTRYDSPITRRLDIDETYLRHYMEGQAIILIDRNDQTAYRLSLPEEETFEGFSRAYVDLAKQLDRSKRYNRQLDSYFKQLAAYCFNCCRRFVGSIGYTTPDGVSNVASYNDGLLIKLTNDKFTIVSSLRDFMTTPYANTIYHAERFVANQIFNEGMLISPLSFMFADSPTFPSEIEGSRYALTSADFESDPSGKYILDAKGIKLGLVGSTLNFIHESQLMNY